MAERSFAFVAGAVLFRLVFDVALALVPAWDDDGQAMLLADSVAGAADLMVAPLIGVVVPVILETDRIENQVVMDVIPVYVGGEDKLIFSPQEIPRQLHADPVGLLRRESPGSNAWMRCRPRFMPCRWHGGGPCKFKTAVSTVQPGGPQQLPVHLVWIADIVDGRKQR